VASNTLITEISFEAKPSPAWDSSARLTKYTSAATANILTSVPIFADTTRMGIYGWSYGGYMTLYTACNAPNLFRAAVAGAPVTDWRNYDTIYTERYMGLPRDNADGYKRSSPIPKAADLVSKLMLVHNLEDDNVHFQNTVQMIDALERAGKPFELVVYPQKSHGVTGPVRKHLYETMTQFLEKHLQK